MAWHAGFIGVVVLVTCIQVLRTRYRRYLRAVPGPLLASFSNLWKVMAIYHGDMPSRNIHAHRKYGPVVRIGPNHVSFASPEAFQRIHASKDAFEKSEFYEVGAPLYQSAPLENLFSLRDAQQHSTLRKNIGRLYAISAVKDFEPHVDNCIDALMEQLISRTQHGPAELDMSKWLHFFAYDCLSAVNISRMIGFIKSGRDIDGMIEAADKVFYLVGLLTQAPFLQFILGHLRATVPAEEAELALKITINEVAAREKSVPSQLDMLSRLLDVHQRSPEKLSIREVTAAVFINLTAGHDVLAITIRAIWYYLARNSNVLDKLRAEIESASAHQVENSKTPYSEIAKFPYLNAVVQETLRIHPNTGTILERKVPTGGATIDGYYLPSGTIVGVNAWVLQSDSRIYGADTDQFRPERWLEANDSERLNISRYLFSFGAGTHTCIGKNIALMMICKIVVEFYRRYNATLAQPGKGWKVHGSWVTKQTSMDMLIQRI